MFQCFIHTAFPRREYEAEATIQKATDVLTTFVEATTTNTKELRNDVNYNSGGNANYNTGGNTSDNTDDSTDEEPQPKYQKPRQKFCAEEKEIILDYVGKKRIENCYAWHHVKNTKFKEY